MNVGVSGVLQYHEDYIKASANVKMAVSVVFTLTIRE